MKHTAKICFGISLMLFSAMMLWSQEQSPTPPPIPAYGNLGQSDSTTAITFDHPEDRMQTPPPVSGQVFPTVITSEERANYLRYGASFTTAYTDNALGAVNGTPVSDIGYTVAPLIALDESTTRLHWTASYAPGFTFYQKFTARNEADQNALIGLTYRLSPHVTLTGQDEFQKSSNVFNQPDFSAGVVSGQTQVANFSIIAPVADRLGNFGSLGISYQFALNDMIGASGTFSNLHYPNQAEVPGLFDSSSQAGSAFYSHRFAGANYIGASYQYQRLMAYPTAGVDETQTQSALFFYSYSPSARFSLSFYGGPQHADTVQPPLTTSQTKFSEFQSWQPAAGASLSWQGKLTALAVTYAHIVTGGSGLEEAVQMDGGNVSLHQMIMKTLTGSVSGGYAQNDLLSSSLSGQSGHSISGTAMLQQLIGQHFSVQLGYTRLHQSYTNVAVISTTPNTNREFVSIAYQFSRPLGR
jgi:hypothetical protein